MFERAPLAFFAGLLSVATPCVLPLVPGYLSVVSAVDADKLGERAAMRRVALSSLPFVAGFTAVFVALGVGATALASLLGGRQTEAAGLILVVVGLALLGLLPWPDRLVAPEMLDRARRRGSGALLGAAFAACAAPCIGPILASVLVLAGDSSTAASGALLLLAYSAGLAVAFLLVGLAFARAVGAMRWLRDHYMHLRVVGGTLLVALGLLLFFDRYYWLLVYGNRLLRVFGLGV